MSMIARKHGIEIVTVVTTCFAIVTALGCDGSALGNEPLSNTPGHAEARAQDAQPPFAVRGDLDGLMLSWFDAQGLHNASKRSEVPEHRRSQVRVDSLDVAPDQRLDPSQVYIADLRSARTDGSYAVHTMERAAFDAMVDKAAGVAINVPPVVAPGDEQDPSGTDTANGDQAAPVVIYMASWCGACKGAAAYLRQRGVPFVERDIEKDRAAQGEMQRKAQAAGASPRGVPVIDFRGTIVLGFDKSRLSQLIDQSTI